MAHVEVPLKGNRLNIEAMYNQLNLYSTYQKVMFPGLIYRPPSSPIVLLCVDSGKIVITGGKSLKDISLGWMQLWPTIKSFVTSTSRDVPLQSTG